MRVLLVGHTGTVGTAVAQALSERGHAVIGASRSTTPSLSTADHSTIKKYFDAVTEPFDAVAVATGGAPFKTLAELTGEDFLAALSDKAAGQIAIAQAATSHLNDNGSITLVSGVLTDRPIATGAAASAANSAVDGFVRAAAGALPRGIRINSVSPNMLAESADALGSSFPGVTGVPAKDVAAAYVRAIEGIETGTVLKVF